VAKCLSFHAAYACRQSGACCSAGWTIPFDRQELDAIGGLALTTGTIRMSAAGGVAAIGGNGRCSFLESDGDRHTCAIHRAGGHAALPLTCRMFPRQVLHDSRGTFISLSHFFPTALALLFDDDHPVAIVDAPAPLAGEGTLDGLDARDVWPPVLRPGVLMDLDSYAQWERRAVELLTREGVAPRVSLSSLARATETIQRWSPAEETPLAHVVRDAFGTLPPPPTAVPAPHDRAVKRWLAARLFGSWIAYQGNALDTVVRYLQACHDIFLVELARDGDPREAIRRSDRLIVHESSSQQIATLLNVST
jgi:Fe-S-cluster containining protein